ncbi:MAG: SUMF1/EgtB/PvdO family nonheme iron enzyme, partial [Caldilinea sp.]|nr:SUMF1/EgtB/PvdO family nonheme iron enzyme [Caldilinea sp.]
LGDSAEWATPVLFSRSDDNRLIELPQGDRRFTIETKPFEPETIFIPGGPFLMGNDDPNAPAAEQPQHTVELPDFRIGKYPVTVREYVAFIKDQKMQPAPPGWFNREPPSGLLDHPVVNVCWHDAVAYCAWLSEQTGRHYRLPSEAEWEKAGGGERVDRETGRQGNKGSGRQKRTYPWGDEWVEGCCNAGTGGTTAVTDHAAGASEYGVEDLLGNVQEWTRSLWGSGTREPDYGYPYDPDDGREVETVEDLLPQMRVVHRGG